MAKPLPPLGRLADLLLEQEGGLQAFIDAQRAEGRSWDLIATEIYLRTERQVYVTDVTVQSWAQRLGEQKAAS